MSDAADNYIENTVSSITSTLLARAIAQDKQAWNRIVDVYGPLVYDWCRSVNLSADDSRDVSQEVFIALSRNLDKFRRDNDNHTFLGWLRTITKRKILDYWRKKKKEPNAVGGSSAQALFDAKPDDPQSLSDEQETGADTIALYMRVVAFVRDRVSDQHWEIFFRLTVQREAPGSVAEELGIERSNVYQIKSRILKMVHEEFGTTM